MNDGKKNAPPELALPGGAVKNKSHSYISN